MPGKFDMNVITIEEAHDITKLKLDELFGSFLTFEMAISIYPTEKIRKAKVLLLNQYIKNRQRSISLKVKQI